MRPKDNQSVKTTIDCDFIWQMAITISVGLSVPAMVRERAMLALALRTMECNTSFSCGLSKGRSFTLLQLAIAFTACCETTVHVRGVEVKALREETRRVYSCLFLPRSEALRRATKKTEAFLFYFCRKLNPFRRGKRTLKKKRKKSGALGGGEEAGRRGVFCL